MAKTTDPVEEQAEHPMSAFGGHPLYLHVNTMMAADEFLRHFSHAARVGKSPGASPTQTNH